MKPTPILLTLSCLVMSIFIVQITTDSTTESPDVPEEKVMMCYWGSWSGSATYPANMSIENFDANLCTHLIFAFAGVRAGDSVVVDVEGVTAGMYAAMIKKKEQNPNLKTLLAIGGANLGERIFPELANDERRTTDFVKSAVDYVEKYKFDGIDMDWEFPGEEDIENFVNLLQKLRDRLDESEESKHTEYLLTAAVGTGTWIADHAYNVSAMDKIIDYFLLMAYDLRRFSETEEQGTEIGHHAPLYGSKVDNTTNNPWNLNDIIKYYVGKGASLKKLVLGVGTYGHTYTMKNRASHNFHDIAEGPGPIGPVLGVAGFMSYTGLCVEVQRANSSRWEFHFDEEQQVPYAFNDNVWVGYDDERSAVAKTQFAIDTGLAGMMVWSIEQDDCNNICGGWYKCPIISAIKRRLDEEKLN